MRKLMTLALIATLAVACKKDDKKADNAAATPTEASKTMEAKPEAMAAAAEAAKAGAEAAKAGDQAAQAGMAAANAAAAAAANLPRPPSVTDEQVALLDKLVTTMTEFGTEMGKAGSDCKAATAAVKTASEKLKPLMADAEKYRTKLDADAAAKAWFQATYVPKMMGSMTGLMTAVQACQKDPEFQAAMKDMPKMHHGGAMGAAPTGP